MSAFLDWLAQAEQARDRAGLRRQAAPLKADEVLDLAGNDYLGLRRHPAVVAGAVAAAETYGGGAGASRLVTGTLGIHEELEEALCRLTGAPSALVFSTGYHANLSVLTALADDQTLIVSDAHAHASLIDGARLSRGTVAVSRHNDLDHVRELLAGRSLPRALVVVESVYSVLGDAAPLADLAELASEYAAVLVVDDAHGIGVVGPARRRGCRGGGPGRPRPCRGDRHAVQVAGRSGRRGARAPRRAGAPRQHRTSVHLRHGTGSSRCGRRPGRARGAGPRTRAGAGRSRQRREAGRGLWRRPARGGGAVGRHAGAGRGAVGSGAPLPRGASGSGASGRRPPRTAARGCGSPRTPTIARTRSSRQHSSSGS